MQAAAQGAGLAVNQKAMNLCNLLLFCLGTASLSQFVMKCQERGMIFRKLRNWREYWLALDKKVIEYKYPPIPDRNGYTEKVNHIGFDKNRALWLNKILGGCVYCFGTWAFIVLFLCLASLIRCDCLTLVGLFIGLGFNYLFIELIQKLKRYA